MGCMAVKFDVDPKSVVMYEEVKFAKAEIKLEILKLVEVPLVIVELEFCRLVIFPTVKLAVVPVI